MATDFEAEGLLDGLDGEAKEARRELLEKLEGAGFELDELREAAGEGRLALLPVEKALSGGGGSYTAAEVAEKSGLGDGFYDQIMRATGVALPGDDEAAFGEAELEGAKRIALAREAGLDDEALLELTRAMSRSAASLATTVTRVFGRSLIRPGDNEHELGLRYAEAARELRPLLSEGFDNVLAIRLREEVRQAALDTTELESGVLSAAQDMTVCFADLVGFTRLGEKLAADEIGAMAERFEEMAADVAEGSVRLVKMIGDAAMLVSAEPGKLVDASLELIDAADAEGDDFPQLHIGIASGQTLGRGGDWYGPPVNLASRLTNFARPGSAVATEGVKDALGEDGPYRWSRAGKRKFKGVKGEVGVYRVRRADPSGEK